MGKESVHVRIIPKFHQFLFVTLTEGPQCLRNGARDPSMLSGHIAKRACPGCQGEKQTL